MPWCVFPTCLISRGRKSRSHEKWGQANCEPARACRKHFQSQSESTIPLFRAFLPSSLHIVAAQRLTFWDQLCLVWSTEIIHFQRPLCVHGFPAFYLLFSLISKADNLPFQRLFGHSVEAVSDQARCELNVQQGTCTADSTLFALLSTASGIVESSNTAVQPTPP